PIQTGVGRERDLSLRTLRDAGAVLTGRFLEGDGTTVRFADDLPQNAARADEFALRFMARVYEYILDAGIDAPPAPPFQPFGGVETATELDLEEERISNVIWSTGFRLDFSWIDLDLNVRDGYPEQTQGVSRHPGLYFMGLQLMHTRKSGLIFGVGSDAAHISGVIGDQLGARTTDNRD